MIEKQLPYKYQIYDTIKKEILSGRYAPGDTLNERQLCEDLGISRTPVREGLQMLAQDGWLQMETYKSAVVREFDVSYLRNLSRIRSALEVCAVEDAVHYINDGDIERLEKIQAQQSNVLLDYDDDSFILLDRKFHTQIYNLSRNDELITLLENYYDIFRLIGVQAVTASKERRLTTLSEHQAILTALKSRDMEESVFAMRHHMRNTLENMTTHLQNRSRPQ